MQLIDISNLDLSVTAKFNAQNKFEDYTSYLWEIQQNLYGEEEVKITKCFNYTIKEYEYLRENLLEDNLYFGGSYGNSSGGFIKENEEWTRTGILIFNEVTHEGLIIDPQGYSYARYVGIIGPNAAEKLYKEVVTKQSIITFSGMSCDVYRNSFRDCSNKSISSYHNTLLLIGESVPEISQETDITKIVSLRNNGSYYAEPIGITNHKMMGGNFLYSCDSKFRSEINPYPIRIHDRFER